MSKSGTAEGSSLVNNQKGEWASASDPVFPVRTYKQNVVYKKLSFT